MIEALSSLALIGSGAYLYLKGKGEKTDTTGSKTSVDSQSSADRIIAQKKSQGDTSVDKTSDYNARGESVVEQGGEQIAQTTENKMYFGDKDNYDQFYDYSADPIASNNSVLTHSSAVDNAKDTMFRARIVAPFLAECSNYPSYNLLGDRRNNWMGKDPQPYFSHAKVGGENIPAREYSSGNMSEVGFVLEVFNPYSSPAPLSKIAFSEIKIGGDECVVFNPCGLFNGYDTDDTMIMNKHIFEKKNNVWKINNQPYIMNVSGIKIPAKDSVFIPVVLPLAIVDKIYDASDDIMGVLNSANSSGRASANNIFYDIFKLDNWGTKSYLKYHSNDGYGAYWQVLTDKNDGCKYWFWVDYKKPKDVANYDLSFKVTLASDSQNFVHNYENGLTDVYNTSSHYLSLHHSKRVGYDKWDSWKDSYMGDAQPTFCSNDIGWVVQNALAENIFKYNGGKPIYEGFPTSKKSGYYWEFDNDYNQQNLG